MTIVINELSDDEKRFLTALLEPSVTPVVREMAHHIVTLVEAAMNRKTGPFSYDDLFNEVRPAMPVSDLPWMTPALIDKMVRNTIKEVVEAKSLDRCFDSPDEELKFLDTVLTVMKQRGFETAGQALEYLQRKSMN